MSYILEAIRKSEQERQEHNHVPNLNAMHTQRGDDDTSQGKNWFWLILLMAIAILVLLALQFRPLLIAETKPTNTPNPRATVTSSVPQNTIDSEAPVTQPSEKTKLPVQPAQPVQPPIPEATQPAVQEQKTIELTSKHPQPMAANDPAPKEVQALYQQQATQAQINKLNEPQTLKNLPSAKQIDELNQVLAQKNATTNQPAPITYTSVYDIPESVAEQIPTLKFGAHIYSETTDSGFTIINGRKYLPGSEISPGLTLLRIQPDKVILKFRGYEFSMPAMRDWIKR